jgi:nitrite reductase/ring-hydroxylating ferredoxin subunit
MDETNKPDLNNGVPLSCIPDPGKLLGADGEDVLLVRHGREFFAVGAHCTHYDGPLPDGLVADDEVRCPWHHPCFSLRTGEALHGVGTLPILS